MIKTIDGKDYELVDQTKEEQANGACGGCIGYVKTTLCSRLSDCTDENLDKCWKEVSND